MYYVYGIEWKIVKIVISILVSRKLFKNVKKKITSQWRLFKGQNVIAKLLPPLTLAK